MPETPIWPGHHLLVTGDSVIVSVPDAQRIVRYTLDGKEMGDIGAGQTTQPVGLAIDAGRHAERRRREGAGNLPVHGTAERP